MVHQQIRYQALERDARLRAIYGRLMGDIRRRLSLKEAASLACLEEHYFSAYFRKHVGVSFSYWQGRLRVQHAKALLAFSNRSISQIAGDVGYENLTAFGRLFRRHTSMSPSDYRALRLKNRP